MRNTYLNADGCLEFEAHGKRLVFEYTRRESWSLREGKFAIVCVESKPTNSWWCSITYWSGVENFPYILAVSDKCPAPDIAYIDALCRFKTSFAKIQEAVEQAKLDIAAFKP